MRLNKLTLLLVAAFSLIRCGYDPDQKSTRSPDRNFRVKDNSDESADVKKQPHSPVYQKPKPSAPDSKPDPIIVQDPVDAGLEKINQEFLKTNLHYITQDVFNGRLSGTEGNAKIADYIIGKLEEYSIPPASTQYRQSFKIKNGPTKGKETSNIIAYLEGNDPKLKNEYIVIGAHMDHAGSLSLGYTCSKGSSNSNQICNGADDNGSGTVSVLSVARALASVRENLKRSVVFMWFSGEELGLEGSWHYVSNPIFPLEDTVYMINMDMVGYMSSYGQRLAALGGETSPEGSQILGDINQKYETTEIQQTAQAGGGSDHVPFMSEGIPGVFFHTGVRNNSNYHRTSDTPDLIDYDGLELAAKIAFETLYQVSNVEMRSFSAVKAGKSKRPPLVSEYEKKQTCHHLGLNPHANRLDFTFGNDGL